jgi:hypothetical protein
MSVYYPFGKPVIPTEEKIIEQKTRFEKYDYYGISYGCLDGEGQTEGEGYYTEKDKDRAKARLLILGKKEIPKDLEERLLKYKQQDIDKKRDS